MSADTVRFIEVRVDPKTGLCNTTITNAEARLTINQGFTALGVLLGQLIGTNLLEGNLDAGECTAHIDHALQVIGSRALSDIDSVLAGATRYEWQTPEAGE